MKRKESASMEFMIDSGVVYSLVQSDILDNLGIKPYKTVDFTLADGTKINRNVGDAYFGYLGEGGAAPVMFGQDGDRPLLGVTALEVSDWYIILLKESCVSYENAYAVN